MMAENAYYLGDYDEAQDFLEQSVALNQENEDAISLADNIKLRESGHANVIRQFVDEYYLYGQGGMYEGSNTVSEEIDEEDASTLFYSLINEDDPYSFYINKDWYSYMIEEEEGSIDFEVIDENTVLANVIFFGEDTDHHFVEYIDEIESPEEKTLIINVIDNAGGITDSAYVMLDTLLPHYTAFTLIDRMGYTYPYFTSESMVKFKNIYVLINGNSASASELLALGLNTYLTMSPLLVSKVMVKV